MPVGGARHWRLDNTDYAILEGDRDGWTLVAWADENISTPYVHSQGADTLADA